MLNLHSSAKYINISFFCSNSQNGPYNLQLGDEELSVYCDMNGADLGECGAGGWTLVMKTDGNKVFQTIMFRFRNATSRTDVLQVYRVQTFLIFTKKNRLQFFPSMFLCFPLRTSRVLQ